MFGPIAAILFFVFGSCTQEDMGCDVPEAQADVVSPGGAMIARAYALDCGATTALSGRISIRLANEKFVPARADTAVGPRYSSLVALRWISDEALEVTVRGASLPTSDVAVGDRFVRLILVSQ